MYYDIGVHVIDLTIVKAKDAYYAFHKTGEVENKFGNRMMVSPTLNPTNPEFTFGINGYGEDMLPNQTKPTEGPEIIKLIEEEKWYVYGDPFDSALEAWETTDFKIFSKMKVSTPLDSKHCSFIPITKTELDLLLKSYPPKK